MITEKRIKTDVLVIGGGNAGCFAAINACLAGAKVTLVDKAYAGKSGASIMGSGFWAAFNPKWNSEDDFQVLMKALDENGSHINDRRFSEMIMRESWGTYQDLVDWGVEMPAQGEENRDWYFNNLVISRRRATAHGTATAMGDVPYTFLPVRHRKVQPVLRKKALEFGVNIIDRTTITELLKQNGRASGAVGFSVDSGIAYIFEAKAVIMAGGMHYLQPAGFYTNSITGDADALAYRIGAAISGKEFDDCHFAFAKNSSWKGNGELYPPFMNFRDNAGRHVVVEAMDMEMTKAVDEGRGPIYWDLSDAQQDDIDCLKNYSKKRANPVETERIGLYVDEGKKWQVAGGHAMGGCEEQASGIWPVDTTCETEIPGLYAAGDCCCSRCWGAIKNGAPWGLMPAAVEGKVAGKAAAASVKDLDIPDVDQSLIEAAKERLYRPIRREGGFDPRWSEQILKDTMTPYFISQMKNGERLKAALTYIEFVRDRIVPKLYAHDYHELRLCHEVENSTLNCEMILRAGMAREETRGRHYREEFPEENDKFLGWFKFRQGADGKMKEEFEAIPKEWMPEKQA